MSKSTPRSPSPATMYAFTTPIPWAIRSGHTQNGSPSESGSGYLPEASAHRPTSFRPRAAASLLHSAGPSSGR